MPARGWQAGLEWLLLQSRDEIRVRGLRGGGSALGQTGRIELYDRKDMW